MRNNSIDVTSDFSYVERFIQIKLLPLFVFLYFQLLEIIKILIVTIKIFFL